MGRRPYITLLFPFDRYYSNEASALHDWCLRLGDNRGKILRHASCVRRKGQVYRLGVEACERPCDGRSFAKHRCCSKEHPEVCPTQRNLKDMTQFGLWTEGVAGKFHLEVKWIRAGFGADGCSKSEYCCPDAKHCLTPTKTSCKHGSSV